MKVKIMPIWDVYDAAAMVDEKTNVFTCVKGEIYGMDLVF